jgi:hypothetical protein
MREHRQNPNPGKGCLAALGSWRRGKRGQSTIEYAAIMFFIMGALFVFQKYIARGMNGRWKGVGDAIGQGRIYDPNYTTECDYHPTMGWFDRVCFEGCRNNCGAPADPACAGCVGGCKSAFCDS